MLTETWLSERNRDHKFNLGIWKNIPASMSECSHQSEEAGGGGTIIIMIINEAQRRKAGLRQVTAMVPWLLLIHSPCRGGKGVIVKWGQPGLQPGERQCVWGC